MADTVTVREAARRLGMNEQGVREHLKRGEFPFGTVMHSLKGNTYRYVIPRQRFEEYLGTQKEPQDLEGWHQERTYSDSATL